MKLAFNLVGERYSCLTMSNLGVVNIPEEMAEFVNRMDFTLGVQAASPNNCGIISYNGKLYINFIRDTKEAELEREFFTLLRSLGIHSKVESNSRPYLNG